MDYLPLGTMIQMKGAKKLFMIVARGLVVKQGDEQVYTDYGVVTYPEGLIGDRIYYMNSESIARVVAEGYRDSEEEKYAELIGKLAEKSPYKKIEIKPLR